MRGAGQCHLCAAMTLGKDYKGDPLCTACMRGPHAVQCQGCTRWVAKDEARRYGWQAILCPKCYVRLTTRRLTL